MSKLNPDWLSYQRIYESGGAWLSEQGRDPAFLTLNAFLASVLGANSYETYRVLLALYFMVFMALLSAGRIFKINPAGGGYVSLLLSLVYLGFTRFTIQIREGIAISIVIFVLALFAKHSCSQKLGMPWAVRKGNVRRALQTSWAWILLILAGMTHASMLFVLLIALAACWATARGKVRSRRLGPIHVRPWRMRLLWVLAFFLAGAAVMQLYLGASLMSVAAESVGDRFVNVKALTAVQLGFWCLYGGACWLVYREVRVGVAQRQVTGMFATFLRVLSGPAVMATYASIVLALLLAVTPLFIVSYVRLLHMFLALALLCLAVIGRRGLSMQVIGVFLIADQVRSIVDSI
ncbi:EpsG family protein [Acidovorax soli]|uniref:EpsG family protein n=1 Tax=Acidovorax soli TaxID=592050 RepID=UPI001114FEA2|nr:EpsG family protein [Acidovorax soli]